MIWGQVLCILVTQYSVLAMDGLAGNIVRLVSSGKSSPPTSPKAHSDTMEELRRRQDTTSYLSTCGFLSGNPSKPRTANTGFDCRTDTINGLWGFCPTTVISATDCGLAGNCVDNHGCVSGCGIFGTPGITTFTCTEPSNDYCSTAILTVGDSANVQTYNYIACGSQEEVDHLLATTTTSVPSTTTSSPAASAALSTATISPTLSPTFTSAVARTTSFRSSAMTSPASVSSSSSSPSHDPVPWPSSSIGAIVGGSIGGLALIAFVVLGFIFLRRYKAFGSTKPQSQDTVLPAWKYGPQSRSYECSNGITKSWVGDNKAELPGGLPQPPAYPIELPSQRSPHL